MVADSCSKVFGVCSQTGLISVQVLIAFHGLVLIGLMFYTVSFDFICRRVKFLSLEGCSLLTTEGFESVALSWVDLQRLAVVSCNNIKDDEVSPSLSSLFSVLKEFKWRPDTKSVLAMSLVGTGMGRGGRFFKRI